MKFNAFDIKKYVEEFHVCKKPGLITNGRGAILEANSAAAALLSVNDTSDLKSKLLVSYVHRKNVHDFYELRHSVVPGIIVTNEKIWLRPRKSLPFLARFEIRMILENKSLALLRWDLENANEPVQPDRYRNDHSKNIQYIKTIP